MHITPVLLKNYSFRNFLNRSKFGVKENVKKLELEGDWADLGPKICFFQTIPDKTFGIKWSNPVKLDRQRKVWYVFLHVF